MLHSCAVECRLWLFVEARKIIFTRYIRLGYVLYSYSYLRQPNGAMHLAVHYARYLIERFELTISVPNVFGAVRTKTKYREHWRHLGCQ